MPQHYNFQLTGEENPYNPTQEVQESRVGLCVSPSPVAALQGGMYRRRAG